MTTTKLFIESLQKQNLKGPDRRYLYEYKISEELHHQMQEALTAEVDSYIEEEQAAKHLRCFPAVFVLYAAELFKVNENLTISNVFQSIGRNEIPQLLWSNLVQKGLKIWNQKVEVVNGQKRYKETLVTQGGLPLARQATAAEFQKVLDQALHNNITIESTQDDWFDLVALVWDEDPYFPTTRKTTLYYKIAARFLKALYLILENLRKDPYFTGNIKDEIDILCPNWVDDLPIFIPPSFREDILKNLFRISNKIQDYQQQLDFIKTNVYLQTHGAEDTQKLVREIILEASLSHEAVNEMVLNQHPEQFQGILPQRFSIKASLGNKSVRLGIYRKTKNRFQWRSSTSKLEHYTDDISLLIEHNNVDLPLVHTGHNNLQSLVKTPCFFDSQTKHYLGNGSISIQSTSVLVVLPQSQYTFSEGAQIERVGQVLKTNPMCEIWRINTTEQTQNIDITPIDDNSQTIYRISLGNQENVHLRPVIVGERVIIGNKILPMYKSIQRIMTSPTTSVPPHHLEYRYIGTDQWVQYNLDKPPFGKIELRHVVNNITQLTFKMQLVPNELRFSSDWNTHSISIHHCPAQNITFTINGQIIQGHQEGDTWILDCEPLDEDCLREHIFGQIAITTMGNPLSFQFPTPIQVNALTDKIGRKISAPVVHIRHLSGLQVHYSNGHPKINVTTLNTQTQRVLTTVGPQAANNISTMSLDQIQTDAMAIWSDNPNPSNTQNMTVTIVHIFPTPPIQTQICRFEGKLACNDSLIWREPLQGLDTTMFHKPADDYENFVVEAWPMTLPDRGPVAISWDPTYDTWRLPKLMRDDQNYAGTWVITARNATGWNILRATVVQLHPNKVQEFDKFRYTQLESIIEQKISSSERKTLLFNNLYTIVTEIHNGQRQLCPEIRHIVTTINLLAGKVAPVNVDLLQVVAYFPSVVATAYLCCDYYNMGNVSDMFTELPFVWELVTQNDWKVALQFADHYWHNRPNVDLINKLEHRLMGVMYEFPTIQTLLTTDFHIFLQLHCTKENPILGQNLFHLCTQLSTPSMEEQITDRINNISTTLNSFSNELHAQNLTPLNPIQDLDHYDFKNWIILNDHGSPNIRNGCIGWAILGLRAVSESKCTFPSYMNHLDFPEEQFILTPNHIFAFKYLFRVSEDRCKEIYEYEVLANHPQNNQNAQHSTLQRL